MVVVAVAGRQVNRQPRSVRRRSRGRRAFRFWRLEGRRALRRAPRPALDRRQHLQGGRGQRPPRHGGRLRRHRPGPKRLPARGRDRPSGRRGSAAPRPRQGSANRRADQAAPGGPGPGGQGPAEDEGRAALDAALDRRPLPRLHAAGRRGGSQPATLRVGARAPAQAAPEHPHRRGRRDRPHRRPGRPQGRLRARHRLPAQAVRGRPATRRGGQGPGHGVPGGRPLDPRPARRADQGVRPGDHRRPQAAPPGDQLLPAHGAGARSPWRSCTRTASRCSSAWASRSRTARCSRAGSS